MFTAVFMYSCFLVCAAHGKVKALTPSVACGLMTSSGSWYCFICTCLISNFHLPWSNQFNSLLPHVPSLVLMVICKAPFVSCVFFPRESTVMMVSTETVHRPQRLWMERKGADTSYSFWSQWGQLMMFDESLCDTVIVSACWNLKLMTLCRIALATLVHPRTN